MHAVQHAIAVRRVVLGAAMVLLTGCAEAVGTTDSPLAGETFVLAGLQDGGLPVVTSAYQGDTSFIVADTLRFLAGGQVARAMHVGWRGVHGADSSVSRWSPSYRLDGARIRIGFFRTCPSNALCAADDVGTLLFSTLWLTADMEPAPPSRRYRRIGTP